MTVDPLDVLLGRPGRDPGCEAAFEQLDRYCEAVLRGADAASEFPEVALHLRNCIACREDTEGLLAVLARDIPDVTGS
ncbi:MAG TPA: hypothetical protein VFZ69_04705 [Longimicrobiales bacterium]